MEPEVGHRWSDGARVRVTAGGTLKGLDGTVSGPATQAGMDVVVLLDAMWPAEFRNWEMEARNA